jgi:hypothetical protein
MILQHLSVSVHTYIHQRIYLLVYIIHYYILAFLRSRGKLLGLGKMKKLAERPLLLDIFSSLNILRFQVLVCQLGMLDKGKVARLWRRMQDGRRRSGHRQLRRQK